MDAYESSFAHLLEPRQQSPRRAQTRPTTLAATAPLLAAIVQENDLESIASSAGIATADPTEAAYCLCSAVRDEHPHSQWLTDAIDPDRTHVALSLQIVELSQRLLPRQNGWALQSPDLGLGLHLQTETISTFRPTRSFGCRDERFTFDVRPLLKMLAEGAAPEELRRGVIALEAADTEVCFLVRANATRTRFILGARVAALLGRCDGNDTCAELERELLPSDPHRSERLLPIWRHLYEAGAITLT